MGRPAHQTTTRNLGAAYPFATEPGLGAVGVLVGRDLIGGTFCYDPLRLYRAGILTKANLRLGPVGAGQKSAGRS